MESRLKMRVSRMFRSSFGSCRTRNFSDVMEKAVFTANYHPSSHLIEPMSPRLRPFPSIFRPTKSFETSESLHSPCFESFSDDLNGSSRLLASRSCENEFDFAEKVKESPRKKDTKRMKKKKKKTQMKIKHKETTPFSYSAKDADFDGNWWYSSGDDEDDEDGDDETETLFSSKCTSSDSSRSRRLHRRNGSRRRKQVDGRRVSPEVGVLPLPVKVKDTFAVVKRSSDPYNDFRTSMLEMIVEKQIFAPKDLENLLQCFLSLNSHHHHKIIVEVFTEIYDALFSHWL